MKILILALAFASAQARPGDADAPILRSDFDISPEGAFRYSYETGNGIAAEAAGALKQVPGAESPAVEIKGSARYTSPEGEVVDLTYVADEHGYQPQGSHIPQPPPIPEAIARSLAWIEAHPQPPAPVPARTFPGAVTSLLG